MENPCLRDLFLKILSTCHCKLQQALIFPFMPVLGFELLEQTPGKRFELLRCQAPVAFKATAFPD